MSECVQAACHRAGLFAGHLRAGRAQGLESLCVRVSAGGGERARLTLPDGGRDSATVGLHALCECQAVWDAGVLCLLQQRVGWGVVGYGGRALCVSG